MLKKECGKTILSSPVSREDVLALKTGDELYISGIIYTARDVAHKLIVESLKRGEKPPFDLKGSIIFYAGPAPAAFGQICGSIGPTTAYRMDHYGKELYAQGVKVTIGKGGRGQEIRSKIVETESLYLGMIGGVAALIAKCILSSDIIAYEELGAEALRKMEVKEMPVIVINDAYGGDLYEDIKR